MPRQRLMAIAAALVVALTAGGTLEGQGGTCNRECLIGFADQDLAAMVAKDPKKLPLAPKVKMTDNGQELELGDGAWNSVSGRGNYALHVADPTLGSVVSLVTMREGTKAVPVLMALRLKVINGRISEVEKIVARDNMGSGGAKNLDTMGMPRAALLRPTPPADRVSRAELVKVANMYFSGCSSTTGRATIRLRTTAIGWRTVGRRRTALVARAVPVRIRRPPRPTRRCGPAASSSSRVCCTS